MRASSKDASTALVPTGRSTAAQIVRVATSTAIVTDFGSSGWHWGVEGEAGSGDEAVEGVGPVL
ncbi:hypothetical protein ACPCTO_36145, partial [Streptomyces olivoreticuli]